MSSTLRRIEEFVESLVIVDTHEHLPANEASRPRNLDILGEWLTHYFSRDLVSAGLSERHLSEARDASEPLLERWHALAPFWDAARCTGYGRALALSAQALYGIDHITSDTIEELNRRFLRARDGGNHYRFVLKEKSRIHISLLDGNQQPDPEFFVPVVRFDEYICPTHRRNVVAVADRLDMPIHCLQDWKAAMERDLDEAVDQGAVAVKCGLAYKRSLHFPKAPSADAEEGFNELFHERHSPEWREGIKIAPAFQDHMMHHMLTLADRRGLTVQIHTGLQEGNGNVIRDSNPVLLTNLFLEYTNVSFDIFHMGYPYMLELSNLAKNFPNVFIDMCWGHIISPEAARRALAEWLDAVPANKICAFGGDYAFVDGVYGHQEMARQNVVATLAAKVQSDCFDIDRALHIARWLFVDNPTRLFGLT